MIQTDILVIGGGLSGLMATWQLSRAGKDVLLIEARERFGGRALTIQTDGINSDLGPSWFWDGQPIIDTLIKHFGLTYFEQYSAGAVLVQQPNGVVMQSPMQSPMTGSRRIDGGMTALVNAITNEIDSSKRLLGHAVTALSLEGDTVIADVKNDTVTVQIQANKVALAIPLRIAAALDFAPALPDAAQRTLHETPTWMAGHAKFFAVYDTPFWREKGLSGTAISRRGPLAEIHDASPLSGDVYSLFGFVGLSSQQRAQIGEETLKEHILAQLGAIYGDEALNPKTTFFKDWTTEVYTAGAADHQPQTSHPHYNIRLNFGDAWGDKLAFIVSETAPYNSGLVEGALDAGLSYAKSIAEVPPLVENGDYPEHKASMDWEWFNGSK